jgi:conjugative transfer signal peptidase TraF
MPQGLWWMIGDVGPLGRGEIVIVCPPNTDLTRQGTERGYIETGLCPGGYEPLIKSIAATAGDMVTVDPGGILVNDEPLEGTAQLTQDSAGRPLRGFPAGPYRVAPGEVWILSGRDPRSFDSRYFGPVPATSIQGVTHPVWVAR